MNNTPCENCTLFDTQVRGCTALSDTNFGSRDCPFFKAIPPKKPTVAFDVSICNYCFADKGGECVALIKKPRCGKCRFYKTPEQFAAGVKAAEARVTELSKINPQLRDKYHF